HPPTPTRDQVWPFIDANRNVYGSCREVPDEFRPFDLTWNCRNTQAIHNEVIKEFKGPVQPEVIDPEGRPSGARPSRRPSQGDCGDRPPARDRGGGHAAGHRGALLPEHGGLQGRSVAAPRWPALLEGPAADPKVRALLVDPGLQGARGAGG